MPLRETRSIRSGGRTHRRGRGLKSRSAMTTKSMASSRRDFVLTMRSRDLPPEWGGVVPTEAFIEEALRVVKTAETRGVHLRILGGLGIRLHCPSLGELGERLRRSVVGPSGQIQEYTDLDLMGYWR